MFQMCMLLIFCGAFFQAQYVDDDMFEIITLEHASSLCVCIKMLTQRVLINASYWFKTQTSPGRFCMSLNDPKTDQSAKGPLTREVKLQIALYWLEMCVRHQSQKQGAMVS
jgi:hypothetical protein